MKRGQESGERVNDGSLEDDEEEEDEVERERFCCLDLEAMVELFSSPSVLPAHHGAPSIYV